MSRQPQSRFAPLSLKKNFSWTFVGNAIYYASQWGVLIALSNLGDETMTGQYHLGLAVCAPIFVFADLQLRTVQATDAKDEHRFAEYLGLRILTIITACLVIGIVVSTRGDARLTGAAILLVALVKSCESIEDVLYGLLQKHERMDRIAMSMMLKGPLSLAGLALALYYTGSIVFALLAYASGKALTFLLLDLRNSKAILSHYRETTGEIEKYRLRPAFEPRALLSLAWLALPLGFVMMLISLNQQIPKYFIEHYGDLKVLGVFGNIVFMMAAGGQVVGALGRSATPRLSQHYAAGRVKQYVALLLKLAAIGAMIGLVAIAVAWFFGGRLLAFVYDPDSQYEGLTIPFTIIMLAAGIRYVTSFFGYAMSAARYFRAQIPLFVFVCAVTALAAWLMIPGGGLIGTCWVVVVTAAAQLLGTLVVVAIATLAATKRKQAEPQGVADG
jgi:O-antigen/teichoic acid export membrane protein